MNRSVRLCVTAVLVAGALTIPAHAAVADSGQKSVRYENVSSAIDYSGSWELGKKESDDSDTNVTTAKLTGDTAELTFAGTGVDWVARTASHLGSADVFLDGALAKRVDLYSPKQRYQQVVFSQHDLGQGKHTIRVVRTGKHNPSSTGNDVMIDAFDVVGPSSAESAAPSASPSTKQVAAKVQTASAGSTSAISVAPAPAVAASPTVEAASAPTGVVASSRYENTSSTISLNGTWKTNKHSSDSGGNSANAKITGDSAQLAFKSTGIQWISRTGPALGKANVFLDGAKVATVDLYSPRQQFRKTMYVNKSLSTGTHKFRIERTGTKNPASRGNDIVVDSIVVSDAAAPATAQRVKAAVVREGVRVTWNRSDSGDVSGYRLYRAAGNDNLKVISGESLLRGNEFLDVGLRGGSMYRFAVAAVDSSGNTSAKSTAVKIRPSKMATIENRIFNCPSGGKSVSNIGQLRSAVASAKPGSVIKLKPGTYKGGIAIKKSGTAEKPIWICGPRSAVLDNRNTASGSGIKLDNVSHVTVAGMTVQNFRKGVVLSSSSRVTVSDLLIRNIGEEGVKLRYGTTDSTIVKNTVRNTGRVVAMYGEGIYIGSSPKDWCAVYNCKTDKSDRNQIVANTVSGTTADPIEVKPGSSDGVIRNNTVDGKSLVAVTTLMAIKGNDYLITDNVATNGRSVRGLFAGETEVAGYGHGNVFARNRVSVPDGGTAIYVGQGAGNVVDCNNEAVVPGSIRTNGTCQN